MNIKSSTRLRDLGRNFCAPHRDASTQKSLSTMPSLGLRCLRFRTVNCCRSARFSMSSLRRERRLRSSRPNHRTTRKMADPLPYPTPHGKRQRRGIDDAHRCCQEVGDNADSLLLDACSGAAKRIVRSISHQASQFYCSRAA
jgi:hypothetical protein